MKRQFKNPLSQELARKACDKAFEAYAERFEKYNPTADWTTDTHANLGFEAKGVSLSGSINLLEDAIELEMNVPFIFKPFRNKAMDIIEKEIREWIAKAEKGEF